MNITFMTSYEGIAATDDSFSWEMANCDHSVGAGLMALKCVT